MQLILSSKPIRFIPILLIVILVVVPFYYFLSNIVTSNVSIWQHVWLKRIPGLLVNSLSLTLVVTVGTLLLGALLAFLVERTNLPFRNFLRPLLVAPLMIPCYILAICYVNFFGIKGLGEKLFSAMGCTISLPSIYGFWGAAFILSLGAYPYVYTIVAASLSKLDPTFSEAAQCLGMGWGQRLTKIHLPLLLPAFSAGAVLVALYVLSDFGVVSLLRYRTFVTTIYEQMSGRYNYATAAYLSGVLLLLTFVLFIVQELLVERRHYVSTKNKLAKPQVYHLGILKIPAFIFCLGILVIGFILPLCILIYWLMYSFHSHETLALWAWRPDEVIHSGINSLFISSVVATLGVCLSLPLAYWMVRQPESCAGRISSWLIQAGIALPGVFIALGLSFIFQQTVPQLNFSILALVLAFLIHFFAQSFQMTRAGLMQISQRLEEGARLLGYSYLRAFWHISRPLLKPALFSAWILVFLSSMRELPAALLLRPAGFDPLTVKIWIAASEGFYEYSALPSLILIGLSLPLVLIINKTRSGYHPSQ